MALALAQASATAQESLACCKSLLKLAVYQICGLRGLFPDDAFTRRDIAGLTNMQELKASHSPETARVYDWIELGVNNALEARCLKQMIFSIAAANDAPVPEVLEQFVFDFEFAADGSGSVGVTSKGSKAGGKGRTALAAGEAVTVGSMKKQACALLRNLIASISTLGTVPEDRVLSIQLVYNDSCKPDYEPPGFVAADPDALGGFPREPGTLNVGHVRSDHHTVNLTMRSVLDGADEAHGGMRHCPPSAAMGDIGSQHPQATHSDARVACVAPRAPEPPKGGADEGYDSDETCDEPSAPVAAAASIGDSVLRRRAPARPRDMGVLPDAQQASAPAAADTHTGSVHTASSADVQALVARCAALEVGAKVDVLALAAQWPLLPMAAIESALAALVKEGTLAHLPKEQRYVRLAAPAAPVGAPRRSTRAQPAPVADLTAKLARCHAAETAPEAAAPPSARKKRGAAAAEQPTAPIAQQAAAKRARKMSAPEHPIRQRATADDVFSAAML